MFALAWIFLADLPEYRTGLIIVGLARCIATGRIAAHGPDHEPLLVDAHPVAVLDDRVVHEARRLYLERFQAGRDSTDPQ